MHTRRFKVAKLVRDKMEAYMISNGVHGPYQKLSPEELTNQLKAKIVEEAQEVAQASNPQEMQKELADLLEVIAALHAVYDLDRSKTEKIKAEKYNRLGGFEEGLYVPYADIESDNPFIENYLNQPEKYPEIL